MTHITCRLTAKNRDQLRNRTLGNRLWATRYLFTLGKKRSVNPFPPNSAISGSRDVSGTHAWNVGPRMCELSAFWQLFSARSVTHLLWPFITVIAPTPRSIVMNVSVCLCVYLSAIISQELHVRSSPNFFCECRGSIFIWRLSDTLRISGLLMTSYLTWGCSTSPPGRGSEAHTQPWAWRVGIPVTGSGRSGLLLAVRAY